MWTHVRPGNSGNSVEQCHLSRDQSQSPGPVHWQPGDHRVRNYTELQLWPDSGTNIHPVMIT